jgi:allophanate hydrolase subunit 2
LAQCRPGDSLRLQPVDAGQAEALSRARRAQLARLHHAVADRQA